MLDFVTDALAAHRLTHLIVADTILDKPRERLKARLHDGGHTMALEWLHCPWCVGMWAGFAVVAARRIAPRAWPPIARALACASVAGIVSSYA